MTLLNGILVASVLIGAFQAHAIKFTQQPDDSLDARWLVPSNGTAATQRPVGLPSMPSLKLGTFATVNSDRIVHSEYRVGIGRPDNHRLLKWYGADAVHVRGVAEWIDYRAQKSLAFADVELFRGLRLNLAAGYGEVALNNFQHKIYGVSYGLPLWKLRATYAGLAQTEFRLEGINDFVYAGWLDRGGGTQFMTVQNLFAEVETFRFPGWQLRSNFRESFLSDSNQQTVFDHLILRDVFLSPFVLKAGAGGGWFNFQQSRPGYWNPSFFEVYGLRVWASKRIRTHWTAETRLSYGFHRERGRQPGPEAAAEVILQYQNKNGWLVRLAGNALDSENGSFWRRDVALNVEIPF